MKRTYLFIACCFVLFQGAALAERDGYLRGEIVSSFADRIDLSLGDKVIVSLGKAQGATKGDIAKIAKPNAEDPLTNIVGRCAVIETEEASAVCEIIQSRVEMHRGDSVFLKATTPYADPALYPLALKSLYSAVNAYEPNKKLSVYVYNIFDDKNQVTGLSDRIRREIVEVMRQKSRIKLADRSATMEAFYPTEDMQWVADVRQFMKKADVDVLITGVYSLTPEGHTIITIYKVDLRDDDRRISFSVPPQQTYAQLASEVHIPYQKIARKEEVLCSFILKPLSYVPLKDEKTALIKFEADGNPFTEYNIKRDDFNIISPVEVRVEVDGEAFSLSLAKPQQLVTLTKGVQHRVSTSFRRGYYFNENLLYKSRKLLSKEVLLDVSKSSNVLVNLSIDPLPDKQPITIQVFDRVGKERQLLRPIRRLEADATLETFKD
jgi:hypothetical protein